MTKHKKYARAYTLFQFSIEEIGKAFLTFQFVLYGNIEDAQETKIFFVKFLNHIIKTESSQSIDFMFSMIAKNSFFTKGLLQDSLNEFDKTNISNNYKNYSLYTSLIDGKFHKPCEIIFKDRLEKIAHYAKLRLQISKPFLIKSVKNYDALFETRNDYIDKEALSVEIQNKIKELDKFDSDKN